MNTTNTTQDYICDKERNGYGRCPNECKICKANKLKSKQNEVH